MSNFSSNRSNNTQSPGINTSASNNNTHNSRFAARHRQEQETCISDVIRQYDDRGRIYNITIPRQQFQLGGYQLKDPTVPRGREGIDAMERDMREMRAQQNVDADQQRKLRRLGQTFEHRNALEDQMNDKTRFLEETRNLELEEDMENLELGRPYGPCHDERAELEWKKRQQARQKEHLEKQISDKAIRDAEEAQHFAAPKPDWEEGFKELDGRIHRAMHGDPDAWRLKQQQENQPKVIQDTRDSQVRKKEMDVQPVSMEVAMFADRILLAEKAKRDNRERYKAELDEQVRQRTQKKQSDLYNNIIIDRSYHFGALKRAAPPTPEPANAPSTQRDFDARSSNFSVRSANVNANATNKNLFSADHYSATPQRNNNGKKNASGKFW